jgi:DNA-binding beta-propeller fold protein YncE
MLVIDDKTGIILATLQTGNGTDGAAFDPGFGYAFASNGADGTLTIVKAGKDGKYEVASQVPTLRGARTLAVDPDSHRVFLPTAELGSPAEGQPRPSIKPGTFMVLVYEPVR